ncbi:lactococcin 972 family bacteriocin [Tuberibacillus calidus]|uniref:lactococcin 972 family bacteriocin n=1 Tax=Tuberibacillus calidus TaxID=340097 RepID=UPI0004873F2D|nr:lactococcin 972 family bacteriocin [Tuberibacillus calidus]
MSGILTSSKTVHVFLRKVMTLVGVLVLSIIAFGLANPNHAAAWLHPGSTVQYPSEGGKWTYGFWNAMVRSYYYHPTSCHGSTVVYNGEMLRSVDTPPGLTSAAEKGALNFPWSDDAYYYRTCK